MIFLHQIEAFILNVYTEQCRHYDAHLLFDPSESVMCILLYLHRKKSSIFQCCRLDDVRSNQMTLQAKQINANVFKHRNLFIMIRFENFCLFFCTYTHTHTLLLCNREKRRQKKEWTTDERHDITLESINVVQRKSIWTWMRWMKKDKDTSGWQMVYVNWIHANRRSQHTYKYIKYLKIVLTKLPHTVCGARARNLWDLLQSDGECVGNKHAASITITCCCFHWIVDVQSTEQRQMLGYSMRMPANTYGESWDFDSYVQFFHFYFRFRFLLFSHLIFPLYRSSNSVSWALRLNNFAFAFEIRSCFSLFVDMGA